MPVEARFDLPPEEALRHFRGKRLQTGFAWQDTWQQEHDTGFTVAKMADMDLLADVHDAVNSAIAQGTTFQQFSRELTPHLMKKGWWGKQEQVDPLTGQTRLVQLGSARRLQTIFRTNMMSAYAAGEWAQIQATKASAPYLMYDAVDDNRTRQEHKAWDGTVLPVDDAWWDSHRPPNGWNCRCSVIQLSAYDLRAMGKTGPDTAPPIKRREWVNQRTGEVMQVPVGIAPGWAYNPGASRPRSRVAASQLLEKVAAVPAPIGARAFQQIMPQVLPAVRQNFAEFVDAAVREVATPPQRPQGAVEIAGVLPPYVLQFLRARKLAPLTSEVAVQKATVSGAKQARHVAAGDALTTEEWKALPDLLANPEAILFDTEDAALVYVGRADGDRRKKIVLVLDFIYQRKTQLNLVRTGFKVDAQALGQPRYVRVEEQAGGGAQ